MTDGPPLRRIGAGEGGEQQVVVLTVADGDADRVVVDARDAAAGEQARRDLRGVVHGHVEEVRLRRQRCEAEGAQLLREPLALLDQRPQVGRRRKRGERERRRRRRDRQRRLTRVQLRGDVGGRERVADARAGEGKRLRERADGDHAVVEQPGDAVVLRELEVRLVDRERAGPTGSGSSEPVGLLGRQQNVSTGSSSPIVAPTSSAATR